MLAFCHIYKTAGTTFTTLLRRHFGLRHFDRPGFRERPLSAHHLRRIQWVYPTLHSIGGHPVRPYADLEDARPDTRYYTFLRDPLARSISHLTWYLRWKANDGVFFDDFPALLRDWARAPENRNLQCRHLAREATADAARATFERLPFLALRVRHFDASLFLFRHWAGESDMDLRYCPRNTAADPYERLKDSAPGYLERVRAFRERLRTDKPLRETLREANREDQRLVEWVDAELWPRQVEAYPGDLDRDVARFQEENQHTPGEAATEPALPRLYRNAVFKPLRPLLLPSGEPPEVEASPWL